MAMHVVLTVLFFLLHSYKAQHIRVDTSLYQPHGQLQGQCASAEEIDTARRNISQEIRKTLQRGFLSGCNRFYLLDPSSTSGYYQTIDSNGNMVEIYCEMSGAERWGGAGGWFRIAYLDMTNQSQSCPRELSLIQNPTRTCGRRSGSRCNTVTYASQGISYSQICGRLVGYQFGSTEAFWFYNHRTGVTIDSPFVDGGVTITRAGSPRKHVWSFACGHSQTQTSTHDCPCNNGNEAVLVPPWVGEDYFCDSGNPNPTPDGFYLNDPLWDGAGCGSTTTCCGFNTPPWFCKQLPEPISDDIEVRMCGDEGPHNENTPLELIEIYVQ